MELRKQCQIRIRDNSPDRREVGIVLSSTRRSRSFLPARSSRTQLRKWNTASSLKQQLRTRLSKPDRRFMSPSYERSRRDNLGKLRLAARPLPNTCQARRASNQDRLACLHTFRYCTANTRSAPLAVDTSPLRTAGKQKCCTRLGCRRLEGTARTY